MTNESNDKSLARTTFEKTASVKTLSDLIRVKKSENVFLLLDVSMSMSGMMRNGKRRIDGLREVVTDIQAKRRTDMAVFGGKNIEGKDVYFVTRVPAPCGSTPLHDAFDFALANKAGRVVVVSDGWPDVPSLAMDAAKRFGGQVDVVFVGDPGDPGATFLEELAKATGGVAFDGDLSEPKALGRAVIGLLNGDVDPNAPTVFTGAAAVDNEDDDSDSDEEESVFDDETDEEDEDDDDDDDDEN